MANFTLRINTTEKVKTSMHRNVIPQFNVDAKSEGWCVCCFPQACVNHALHFAGFCLAFLISTLLLSLTLLTASCFYKKCFMRTPRYRVRRTYTINLSTQISAHIMVLIWTLDY